MLKAEFGPQMTFHVDIRGKMLSLKAKTDGDPGSAWLWFSFTFTRRPQRAAFMNTRISDAERRVWESLRVWNLQPPSENHHSLMSQHVQSGQTSPQTETETRSGTLSSLTWSSPAGSAETLVSANLCCPVQHSDSTPEELGGLWSASRMLLTWSSGTQMTPVCINCTYSRSGRQRVLELIPAAPPAQEGGLHSEQVTGQDTHRTFFLPNTAPQTQTAFIIRLTLRANESFILLP